MGVDLIHLWHQMGWFAKGIVFVMAIMSIYSLTIVITNVVIKIRTSIKPKFPKRSTPIPITAESTTEPINRKRKSRRGLTFCMIRRPVEGRFIIRENGKIKDKFRERDARE